MKRKNTLGRIGARIALNGSGMANVNVKRSITLPIIDGALDAVEAQLSAQLEDEYAALQEVCALLFRVLQWKRDLQAECELLEQRDIDLRIGVEAEDSRLVVKFEAHYTVGEIPPVMHRVTFDLEDEVPEADDVIQKLRQEWATLQGLLMMGQAGNTEVETRQIPRPFLLADLWQQQKAARAGRQVQLVARPATPEEARSFTTSYLHNFRFPFEVEENGTRFSFVPRVELTERADAVRLIVTLWSARRDDPDDLEENGSKEVAIPLNEIYVKENRLNRKTQEGVLELIKGLCRALGRKRGLTRPVDISSPH